MESIFRMLEEQAEFDKQRILYQQQQNELNAKLIETLENIILK